MAYRGRNQDEKVSACSAIVSANPDVNPLSAWDINELGYDTLHTRKAGTIQTPSGRGSGPESDRYTVQVLGPCFHAAQVNYALFGKMFSLCADSSLSLPLYSSRYGWTKSIKAYKLKRDRQTPSDQEVIEAIDFAHFGYGAA